MPSVEEILFLSGSGPTFIGSGPIASAPDAGTWWAKAPGKIGGLYYNKVATADTPVGPCVSVRSFHNEGIDYGNWGRPTNLIGLVNSSDAYVLEVVAKLISVNQVCVIIALSGGGGYSQFSLDAFGGTLGFNAGGGGRSAISVTTSWAFIRCENNGTTHRISVNGSYGPSFANGAESYAGNIYLNGRTDGTAVNFEGDTFIARFKSASGQCVACFNANNTAQWNGGATATDSAGNPIAFTDGTPLGRVAYSWVSLAKAQEWGILT